MQKKLIFRFTPTKVVGWDKWTANNIIYVHKDEKLKKYNVVVIDSEPFKTSDVHVPNPLENSEYALWFDDGDNKQQVFNLDAIFDYIFNNPEMFGFQNNHKFVDDQKMAEIYQNAKTVSTENVLLGPNAGASTAHIPIRTTGFTETNLFFKEKFDVLDFLIEQTEHTLKDINSLVINICKYYDDYEDQAIAIANKIISNKVFFRKNDEIAFTIIESALDVELDDITKLGIKVIAHNLDLDESVEFLKVVLKNLK